MSTRDETQLLIERAVSVFGADVTVIDAPSAAGASVIRGEHAGHLTGVQFCAADDPHARIDFAGQFEPVTGRWHGMGVLRYANGIEYYGEWLGGAKSGVGVETYPDGSIYRGQFQSDVRHGLGEFMSSDKNSTNAGCWRQGEWGGEAEPAIQAQLDAAVQSARKMSEQAKDISKKTEILRQVKSCLPAAFRGALSLALDVVTAMNAIAATLRVNSLSPVDGYDEFDDDQDGRLSMSDLKAANSILHMDLSEENLRALFLLLDPLKEGYIRQEQWTKSFALATGVEDLLRSRGCDHRGTSISPQADDMVAEAKPNDLSNKICALIQYNGLTSDSAFEEFDFDCDGKLCLADVKAAAAEYLPGTTAYEVERWHEVHAKGGVITLREWTKMIQGSDGSAILRSRGVFFNPEGPAESSQSQARADDMVAEAKPNDLSNKICALIKYNGLSSDSAFEEFDFDCDGKLCLADVKAAAAEYLPGTTAYEVERWHEVHAKGGVITLREWTKMIQGSDGSAILRSRGVFFNPEGPAESSQSQASQQPAASLIVKALRYSNVALADGFDEFDCDADGFISAQDLLSSARDLRLDSSLSSDDLLEWHKMANVSQSGELDQKEWIAALEGANSEVFKFVDPEIEKAVAASERVHLLDSSRAAEQDGEGSAEEISASVLLLQAGSGTERSEKFEVAGENVEQVSAEKETNGRVSVQTSQMLSMAADEPAVLAPGSMEAKTREMASSSGESNGILFTPGAQTDGNARPEVSGLVVAPEDAKISHVEMTTGEATVKSEMVQTWPDNTSDISDKLARGSIPRLHHPILSDCIEAVPDVDTGVLSQMVHSGGSGSDLTRLGGQARFSSVSFASERMFNSERMDTVAVGGRVSPPGTKQPGQSTWTMMDPWAQECAAQDLREAAQKEEERLRLQAEEKRKREVSRVASRHHRPTPCLFCNRKVVMIGALTGSQCRLKNGTESVRGRKSGRWKPLPSY